MRALFTTKKASPKPSAAPQRMAIGGAFAAPSMARNASATSNASTNNSDKLDAILALPMPKLYPDAEYDHMDVFTAASLNSEIVQRYIGDDETASQLANAVNVHRWTPLMYAAYLGHSEMTQLLLTRGADPQAQNECGQTAAMMAASCGSVDVVNVLMRYGAKINCQDKYGRSPLHYAIKYNQSSIAGLLLEKYDADPNLPDFEEMTPTLTACEVGNETTVATLLKHGGDPNRKNRRGESGCALALDHPKVLAALRTVRCRGASGTTTVTTTMTAAASSVCTTTTTTTVPTTTTPSANTAISSDVIAGAGGGCPTVTPPIIVSGFAADDDGVSEVTSIDQLLARMGLEKYTRTLLEHGVREPADLSALTDQRLTEIGITLFGPRKKILNAAQQYRQFGHLRMASVPDPSVIPTAAAFMSVGDADTTDNPQHKRSGAAADLAQLVRESRRLNADVHELLVSVLPRIASTDHGSDVEAILMRLELLNVKLANAVGDE